MKLSSKLKKNKKYGYKPRYSEGEHGRDGLINNPYKFEHKFDKFRTTVDRQGGVKNRFRNAVNDLKREGDRNLRLRFLVIFAILLLIVLYILDFDLSIFFPS